MFSYPLHDDRGLGPVVPTGVGKPIDIKMPDGTTVTAILAGAEVSDDGQMVDLALDVPDDSPMAQAMAAMRPGPTGE